MNKSYKLLTGSLYMQTPHAAKFSMLSKTPHKWALVDLSDGRVYTPALDTFNGTHGAIMAWETMPQSKLKALVYAMWAAIKQYKGF